MQELADKKAIEELRYSYWFALIDKDVDALLKCFDEDAHLEYGFGIVLNGKAEIREFFESMLGTPELKLNIPRGANGLVEILSDNSAKGRWLVEVVQIREDRDAGTLTSVQYFEEYTRVDNKWLLAKMKNDYFYYESVELRETP